MTNVSRLYRSVGLQMAPTLLKHEITYFKPIFNALPSSSYITSTPPAPCCVRYSIPCPLHPSFLPYPQFHQLAHLSTYISTILYTASSHIYPSIYPYLSFAFSQHPFLLFSLSLFVFEGTFRRRRWLADASFISLLYSNI